MSYNPNNSNGQATMANSAPVVIASDQTSIPVTGTFYQATQPVSLASLPSLAAGSNAIGSITNTSFAATQATAASLNATVVGTGTFAVQAAQSGTWNIGTLTSITNAVTVSQSTATSLKTQAENYQGGSAVSSSNPLYTAQLPITSGGVTAATGASTGGASSITISGSAGQVYGWYFYNANSVAAYIFFYDTASAITVGTTSPSYVLVVPPTGGANVFGIGIPHSNSIKIGISQGRAVSTAMSSAVDYNVFYK